MMSRRKFLGLGLLFLTITRWRFALNPKAVAAQYSIDPVKGRWLLKEGDV
jgi:hypothetical protein